MLRMSSIALVNECLSRVELLLTQRYTTLVQLEYTTIAIDMTCLTLELLVNDETFSAQLSSNEKKNAQLLLNIYNNRQLSFEVKQQHCSSVLKSLRRGFGIFDIGFTNGFVYETLVQLQYYLIDFGCRHFKNRAVQTNRAALDTHELSAAQQFRNALALKQQMHAKNNNTPAIAVEEKFIAQGEIM